MPVQIGADSLQQLAEIVIPSANSSSQSTQLESIRLSNDEHRLSTSSSTTLLLHNQNKKGLALTMKFIEKAMAEYRRNDAKKYNFIRNELKKRVNLSRWLKCLKNSVSLLNHDIINTVLSIPLIGKDRSDYELISEYSDFVVNLTSIHTCKYSKFIINSLLRRCFKQGPDSFCNDESVTVEDSSIRRLPFHNILVRMIKISPLNLQILIDCIKSNMPLINAYQSKNTRYFLENILLLSDMMPILRLYIFEFVYEYLAGVDSLVSSKDEAAETIFESIASGNPVDEALVNQNNTGADSDAMSTGGVDNDDEDVAFFKTAADLSGSDGESDDDDDSSNEDDSDLKEFNPLHHLNDLISLFDAHLQQVISSSDSDSRVQIFNLFISNPLFLSSIHLKYSPSIIFKLICTHNDFFDYFISYLLIGLFESSNKHINRINYCSLLTIICRFKYESPLDSILENDTVDQARFASTISHTLLLLSQYLHCMLDSSPQIISPIFYHIVTLVMYIFCFHHELLMSVPSSDMGGDCDMLISSGGSSEKMRWWSIRGSFSRILLCRHQPLELCTPGIVEEFLHACTKYSLFFYTRGSMGLLEESVGSNGNRSGCGIINETEKRRLQEDLSLFYFPFDPHMLNLDIMSSQIANGVPAKDHYREYAARDTEVIDESN